MFEGRRGRMVTPSHRHTAPPSALLAVKIKTNITAAAPCLSGLPVRPPELPAAHQQRASRGSDCSIDPRVRHGPSRVLRDRGSESVATRKPLPQTANPRRIDLLADGNHNSLRIRASNGWPKITFSLFTSSAEYELLAITRSLDHCI